jgi:hypothetical protein
MIVCADDFGLAPDINRAIVELAEAGRVTAVSVMAALPTVQREGLRPLLGLGDKIDMGLHLTLTPDRGAMPARASTLSPEGGFVSYGFLVLRCIRGLVKPADCAAEITAQYNLFVEKAGRTPDFIDGHMHVHQLAGIREGLSMFARTLPKDARPYIRNTGAGFMEIVKARTSFMKQILICAPGRAMKERLTAEGVLTNDGFAGVYDFRQYANYPEFLRRFTQSLAGRPNGLLMTHPGLVEPWRRAEYDALKAAGFFGRVNRFIPPAPAR